MGIGGGVVVAGAGADGWHPFAAVPRGTNWVRGEGAVGAVRVILAARARRFWRAWLLFAVLVALGTAVVLAAVTAGRRADSAFPRFVAAHGYDAVVYANGPLPLARLPGVARTVPIQAPFYGQPSCSCGRTIDQGSLAVREVRPADLSRMVKLVAGRMPDQWTRTRCSRRTRCSGTTGSGLAR